MEKQNKIDIKRHSLSHLMAAAVLELWPGAKFGIGPSIENGFYYDFDLKKSLTPKDLPKIEKKVGEYIKKGFRFEKEEISIKQALTLFKKLKQPYKLELIKELQKNEKAKKVTVYRLLVSGRQSPAFIDLCKGPHVKSAKEIKADAFKLTKLAGAYWKGSEKNRMLQRIYGVAFESKSELDAYLKQQKEAEKRDHRKLGKELDLFSINEKVGPGLILWHPKLSTVREILEIWWRQLHRRHGYQYVYTPHIGRAELWQTSGHLDFFKESMYPPLKDKESGEDYYVKPMNCPFHVQIYNSRPRSYRELPLRWSELGSVYRYEKTGEMHGILRPRGFTQDDAHIICSKEQFKNEYRKVIELTLEVFKAVGFKKFNYYLSVRDPKTPKKYIGDKKTWDLAENTIKEILKQKKINYVVEQGGAKFYGPALDIKILDSIGREWQCPTIQLDMNLPAKFGMTYTNRKGKEEVPIMLHRTVFGSLERFCGILIEHYGGAFPLWLAPVQFQILTIGKNHQQYGRKITELFKGKDLRVELNDSNDTISKKVRDGEMQKIPYLLIVGDKEVKSDSVAVRHRKRGDLGLMKIEKFTEKIQEEIEKKK